MPAITKDWDRHVEHAEEIARGTGFQALRDEILRNALPQSEDRVLDLGAGTGLLTLPLAEHTEYVWALDISAGMREYLRAKAESAGLDNVRTVLASASSVPLVDGSVDLVVSNYCLHHLREPDKVRALREAWRVLRPGGRLVLGDMMVGVTLRDTRARRILRQKVRALVRRGPAGLLRLTKNALRLATGRWERPAAPEWWERALTDVGFAEVLVSPLSHEGGIAKARKPLEPSRAAERGG